MRDNGDNLSSESFTSVTRQPDDSVHILDWTYAHQHILEDNYESIFAPVHSLAPTQLFDESGQPFVLVDPPIVSMLLLSACDNPQLQEQFEFAFQDLDLQQYSSKTARHPK